MLKNKTKIILTYIILILTVYTAQISAAPEVRVMAAASLQEALEEIKAGFEAKFAETELEINYAGSQALFSQIKLGVYFSNLFKLSWKILTFTNYLYKIINVFNFNIIFFAKYAIVCTI